MKSAQSIIRHFASTGGIPQSGLAQLPVAKLLVVCFAILRVQEVVMCPFMMLSAMEKARNARFYKARKGQVPFSRAQACACYRSLRSAPSQYWCSAVTT